MLYSEDVPTLLSSFWVDGNKVVVLQNFKTNAILQ